jgi:DNA modification methylase
MWNGDARELALHLPDGIDCVVTDPPYGIDFQSNFAVDAAAREKHNRKLDNDDDLLDAIKLFKDVMSHVQPKLKPDAAVYVFGNWQTFQDWRVHIEMAFPMLELKQLLIWEKSQPGLGDMDANWGCGYEVIMYFKQGRRPVNFRRKAVMHFHKVPSGQNIHPTQKPTDLLEELISNSTDPGDLVVDPFAGVGSTVVAARNLGRDAIGIELDEAYHAAAIGRLDQLTFDL